MPQTASRPTSRRAQAAAFRVIDIPMRTLLGLPFPTPLGERLMLVHHTGRNTGKHYRQPVSYVRDGSCEFCAALTGRLDRASLNAAIQYGFRVVRWHLDP
ncbi:MAG TPA: hypothetical protein VIY52_27700 [Streptosporangiaceae bacterium]